MLIIIEYVRIGYFNQMTRNGPIGMIRPWSVGVRLGTCLGRTTFRMMSKRRRRRMNMMRRRMIRINMDMMEGCDIYLFVICYI